MLHGIRLFIFCCTGFSASAFALSYASLDDCLIDAVACRTETSALLKHKTAGERDWYMLMYYNLSARWELENLDISIDEVAGYARLENAPDVFRIVVYTIYAKKLLTEGDTANGEKYVRLTRDLIMSSSDRLPDPRRLAELINLYNYLKQYETANDVAKWAVDKTANIQNPYAKAPLNLSIGHVAWFLKDYPRAIEYYRLVVDASEQIGEPMMLAFGQANLAVALRKTEQFELSRHWFEQAIASMQTALGEYQSKDLTYLKLRIIELDVLQGREEAGREALGHISQADVHEHHLPIYDKLAQQLMP